MSRQKKRRNLILSLVIILGSIVASIGMIAAFKKPPEEKETVDVDILVDVIELEEMTARFSVRSQGTVRPRTETS